MHTNITKYSKLIKDFTDIISKLKKEKIIYTGSWKGDIGEYLAIKKFHLIRTNYNKKESRGFDAKDKNGKRVEIKTFAGKFKYPQFGGFTTIKQDFDYAILVVLNEETLTPQKYYKVSYQTIVKYRSGDKKYKRFDLNPKKLEKLKKEALIEEYKP